jgi:sulfonate transport system permease protein
MERGLVQAIDSAVCSDPISTSGIGYMVSLTTSYAQTDVMLVGLLVYAVLGVVSDVLIRLTQKRLLTWPRTLAN